MPDRIVPILQEWQTFYVIAGSAAAALTGLMFVVIALRPGGDPQEQEGGVRAFASPIVFHFCGVLLLASLLTVPRLSAPALAAWLGGAGAAGLAYTAWVAVQARQQRHYAPVASDWLWHVVMPAAAYAGLAAAGVVALRSPEGALDLVAGAVLALLFTGIHNAWDSAVWISSSRAGT